MILREIGAEIFDVLHICLHDGIIQVLFKLNLKQFFGTLPQKSVFFVEKLPSPLTQGRE